MKRVASALIRRILAPVAAATELPFTIVLPDGSTIEGGDDR